MDVSIGKHWEGFVETVLKDGRYGSASEVIRAGLRLVEERESRLTALRKTLNDAIERGGSNDDDKVGIGIDAALAVWAESKSPQ